MGTVAAVAAAKVLQRFYPTLGREGRWRRRNDPRRARRDLALGHSGDARRDSVRRSSAQVKVYDVFIEGAKEGFDVAVRIIPFLVGILVAIGMFRGSGAMDLLVAALRPIATATGFPAELVPLAVLRSLTGSGSLAFTTDLDQDARS